MKLKIFNEKYEKKLKKIDKRPKRYVDYKWIVTVTICSLLMSFLFSSAMEVITNKLSFIIGVILIFLIVIIGVLFDMIGVAITACDIKPFNSMASKKVKASKTAIGLIKNREKVSAFCNDVVGDVCGIVSGSLGILIAVMVSTKINNNSILITVLVTSLISALTIGSKALGKSYAINKSDVIVFKFAKFICFFKREAK